MVDIISTRVSEAYGSIRLPNLLGGEPEDRPSFAALQRFGTQLRRKRADAKNEEDKMRESSLYSLKEQRPVVIHPNTKPFKGLSCKHCAPSESVSIIDYYSFFWLNFNIFFMKNIL